MNAQTILPLDRLGEFCRRRQIRRLSLFGSVLTDEFGPESDIDVLVEFEPGAIIGWKIVEIEDELSQMLGREVDLNTLEDLSRHFRKKVLAAAQVIYERV